MAEQTITEIIKSAGQTLGVSRQELMEQMIDFCELEDSAGIKQMFEAYKNWEIRNRDGKKTIGETIQLAKQNFDCIARIADGYITTGDLIVGMVHAVHSPKNSSGPISQFYRKVINYQTFDPNNN